MGRLAEFLKERRSLSEETTKRRQERLKEWRDALATLFDRIEEWLEEAKKEGLTVRRMEDAKEITERFLGTYTLPVLELEFADNLIRLEPVGRNIIGALGRVDVYTPRGTYMLVRTGTDEWQIVESGGRKRKLTRESFEDLLITVLSA